MNKFLKFVMLPLGIILLLVAVAGAYVAATFDPNAYKPQIVQAVKDKYQRNLKLEGDIDLVLFPNIGARLDKVSLSERGSDREFAGADELRVALKLIPLFSRKVVVDTVEARNLRAHLVRFKDGRMNIDDLAGAGSAGQKPDAAPADAAPPVTIDIAQVVIRDANVTYADETTGNKYAVSKLNVKTGRLAQGVDSKVELAALLQEEKNGVNLATELKTGLVFDLAQQRFTLSGLDFNAKGSAAGVSDLTATAKGDVDARFATREFQVARLGVTATGKREGGTVSIKLDAPRIALTRDKVSGDKITLDAALNDVRQKLTTRLDVSGLEGTGGDFKKGRINGTLDMRREGATIKATLDSGIAGNVEAQRFELAKFAIKLNMNDPTLPKNPVDATITGNAHVDLAKNAANVDFVTKLDESNITGKAGLTRFSPPAITFDVSIDQLDADRYMARDKATGKPAAKPAPAGTAATDKGAGEQPLDLSALKGLDVTGSLRIGTLKAANVRSSQVRLNVRIVNGRLEASPIAANLYQGSLSGALSLQAAATPALAVKHTLTGVNVGPLLKDAANFDMLEGKGNVTVDVSGQGQTVAAIKKALAGKAAIKLTDGAVKGINLAATIRDAKSKLASAKGERAQAASATEKTDFTELSGTFDIKNGVARNSDLSGKSPLLRLGGTGEIDIGNERLDYLLKATVVATSTGQGGKELADVRGVTVPVRLTGSFAAPEYKIDFETLATEIAKGAAGAKTEELKSRVQDQLKDRLKGLFGR